jgi:hypothetical protein
MSRYRVALLLCLFVLGSSALFAQDARGTIMGRVTDPQGAVVPAAPVVITNASTNAVHRSATNETGYYEVPLLDGGQYTVSVEFTGFKRTVRGPVELSVGSRLEINLELTVGAATETMSVTAEAPLLDTTSASGGRVIDRMQIMELPFSDMNPFTLTGLAAGMQWTGQPEYRRPFDNGGTSSFNTSGGVGQNEYSIDGAVVTGTGRRVGFVPPSDAVVEFKMGTTDFDASVGHTSGATVNVMTKSGTNKFHGSLYDQHWQQRWNATQHFSRLQYQAGLDSGKIAPGAPEQTPGRSNQFGATIGGPVWLPKIYNGKDKLFFFFSYNGIYQVKTETTSSVNVTVPKTNWRNGDFSDLLNLPNAASYQVYDPRSAFVQNGHVTRTPFPGNKGIPIMNPMYSFYTKLYPQPNDVAGVVSPEGSNNFYDTNMPKNEKFNSILNRVDYNINDRMKVYGKWYWNHRLADEYDFTHDTMHGLESDGLVRINKGGSGDYVWTINNTTILNITGGYQRFNEGNVNYLQTSFKPSDVGLPAYMDAKAGALHELPRMDISNLSSIGGGVNTGDYPTITIRGSTGTLRGALTKVKGKHSINVGWDERRYWTTTAGPAYTSGRFTFNNSFTRSTDNDSTASNWGLSWAAFMMGLPSSMSVDTNDSGLWSVPWHGGWVQDDWRVTDKLRISIGFRFEWEQGMTERFNRGWAGGFNNTYRYPFSDAVEAAYGKNPIPELAASAFQVQGTGYYLGQNGPRTLTNSIFNYLPKFGVVYQLPGRTVLRAGYGQYADTFNANNSRPSQSGFSQPTSTTMTNDNGLTFCCGLGAASGLSSSRTPLTDPFPVRADGTRFDTPYGNSLAGVYFAGRDNNPAYPRNFVPARQQRWRAGLQHQFGSNRVIDVSYNGAWAKVPISQPINYIPASYYGSGNVRATDVQAQMTTNVPNPFNISNFASLASSNPAVYNYLLTQGRFTATTISKATLLQTYPAVGNVTGLRPGVDLLDAYGGMKYNDLEVQFEQRFTHGFTSTVLYTFTHSTVQDWYANPFDPAPSWEINNNALPHRFVWTGIYQFPFGRGQKFATKGILKAIAGGWSAGWIYQRNSGPALQWNNLFYYGDLSKITDLLAHDTVNAQDIHTWFDPNIAYKGSGAIPSGFNGFEGRAANQPSAYQLRVFPRTIDGVRADGIRNWDINLKRDFRVTETMKIRLQVDDLNATNHTNFSGPSTDPTSGNFGKITSQRGLSRIIQFNLRVEF